MDQCEVHKVPQDHNLLLEKSHLNVRSEIKMKHMEIEVYKLEIDNNRPVFSFVWPVGFWHLISIK